MTIADSIVDEAGVNPACGCPGWTLTKSGAGTLILGGNNKYSGSTVINAGVLSVSANANLGVGGNVLMVDGATLALTGTDTFTPLVSLDGNNFFNVAPGKNASWSGPFTTFTPGSVNVGGGGTLGLLNNANSFTAGVFVSGASTVAVTGDGGLGNVANALTLGDAASSGTLSIASGAFSSNRTVTLGTGGGAIDTVGSTNAVWAGTITGSGGFTKNGTGTLVVTGATSYAGATAVNAGTLVAGHANLFGANPNLTVASGATVNFSGNNQTLTTLKGGGALTLGGEQLTRGNTGASSTVRGSVNGAGSLVKNGGGTRTMLGASTVTGGLAVNAGTLAVNSDAALGAACGLLTLGTGASGATLSINAANFASSRPVVIGGASATIDTVGSTNATLAGSIGGSGGLIKAGTGTLTLSGSNSYAGPTSVTAGTLRAGKTNLFGGGLSAAAGTTVDFGGFSQTVESIAGSGTIAMGAGSLTLGSGNSSSAFGGSITGSGGLTKSGSGTVTLSGLSLFTGGITLNGGVLLGNAVSLTGSITNNATIIFDQSVDGTYTGTMTGSGVLGKNGNGGLTLTGTNTYTGGTVVNAGTLTGNTSSLQGTIVDNAAVVFDQAGTGAFQGLLTGNGTLTKTGVGTTTITGAQPFSGLTSVNQGTLALNGSLNGNVNVGVGGTLIGAGAIAGSVNVFGAFTVPAPGTALATFNSLRLRTEATTTNPSPNVPSLVVNGDFNAQPNPRSRSP